MQLELLLKKPATDSELVLQYLKTGWHSNFEIDNYIKSSQGQRRARELVEKGVVEYKWRECVIFGKKKRWKEFRAKQ